MTPAVPRRTLLRAGLGGAALLGLGAAFSHAQLGYHAPAAVQATLRTLSIKEWSIVEAAASRLMRPDGPGLPDPLSLSPGLAADAMVGRMDSATRTDLLRLLHVLEHLLPASVGKTSRFTRLPGPDQDDVLRAMEHHRVGLLRGAFDGLKSLCALAYYSHPATWQALGYDGPLVGRPADGWR